MAAKPADHEFRFVQDRVNGANVEFNAPCREVSWIRSLPTIAAQIGVYQTLVPSVPSWTVDPTID